MSELEELRKKHKINYKLQRNIPIELRQEIRAAVKDILNRTRKVERTIYLFDLYNKYVSVGANKCYDKNRNCRTRIPELFLQMSLYWTKEEKLINEQTEQG